MAIVTVVRAIGVRVIIRSHYVHSGGSIGSVGEAVGIFIFISIAVRHEASTTESTAEAALRALPLTLGGAGVGACFGTLSLGTIPDSLGGGPPLGVLPPAHRAPVEVVTMGVLVGHQEDVADAVVVPLLADALREGLRE